MKPYSGLCSILAATVLLHFVSTACGHGGDRGTETGHVVNYTETNSNNATGLASMAVPSYFRYQPYSGMMLAHIVVMSLSWIFLLPLAVMFSVARSRLSLPVHCSFVALNGLGVVLAIVYNSNTPDLYPRNSHHTLGWSLTIIACAQLCMAWARVYTDKINVTQCVDDQVPSIPISPQAMEEHLRVQTQAAGENHRFSDDSGHGTDRNTESVRSQSPSLCGDANDPFLPVDLENGSDQGTAEERNRTEAKSRNNVLTKKPRSAIVSQTLAILELVHGVLNRVILIIGFVGLATGIVTFFGMFQGYRVFSGLAHFIKGGVFFWYGILTLGRWAGCFADLGWAWNVKPSKYLVGNRTISVPSAEFVESFLIFLYGSTNVFLEHLGSEGQGWSAQDLEHISITIMFLGGGLCGMLIESTRVGDLLNTTILQASTTRPSIIHEGSDGHDRLWQVPKSYHISVNPLPAIVVLLLGLMMSSHHQSSMVSTMLHKQWGILLVGSAFARAVTYLLFFLSPPTSILPSRPPSELVTSFCLMGGGLMFMASSSDTVAAIEYNDLDAMFVFTVTMGLVNLLMAWIILVIAIKGWAIKNTKTMSNLARLSILSRFQR